MKSSNLKKIKDIGDFFTGMYYFFIGLLAISVVVDIVKIFTGKFNTRPFPMMFKSLESGASLHANGLEIIPRSFSGVIVVSLTEAPISMSIISSIAIIVKTILIIFMISIIRNIIGTIKNNNLFSEINANRLKKIGYILLANFLLSILKEFIFSMYFGSFHIKDLGYYLGYLTGSSLAYILVIIFIFFIAAIFRIGVSIQAENESFV